MRARVLSVLVLLIAGFLLPSLPCAAKAEYKRGETLVFKGRVRDAEGEPLAGVTVVLEVSRAAFKLRYLGRKEQREKENTLQLLATTDALGEYRIEWGWDGFYNLFELGLAIPVPEGDGMRLDIVGRRDITAQVEAGSPIVGDRVFEAGHFVAWVRRHVAGTAGADEEKIYREMGRPDRLDVSAESGESSWWYFSAGKVYRFKEGALEQVTHFDPVD